MSEPRTPGVLAQMLHQVPSLLVLAGLAALGWWGAANEWRLPFAAPPPEKKGEAEKKPDSPGLLTLDDDDSADHAGVETVPVKRQELLGHVEAPAVLAFDAARFARLAPRAAGTVYRVACSLGTRVKRGDALLLVASPETGKLKADLLSAAIQHDARRKALEAVSGAGIAVPARQLREAQVAAREARVALVNAQQALANLGLDLPLENALKLEDDELARRVRRLGSGQDGLPGNLLPVVAPFDGVVVRLEAVLGEMAETGKPLVAVADPSRIWCLIDVRQEEAARLAVGQPVTYGGRDGEPVEGTLAWISPEANEKTRTVQARAVLANSSGTLRPGAYGSARVETARRAALMVPVQALQFDGGARRVFVRRSARVFEPRMVLAGGKQGGGVELRDPTPLVPAALLAGGWPALGLVAAVQSHPVPAVGELVATTGSHALLSELLKARIGGDD